MQAETQIIPFLTSEQLKLLGKGRNNAVFSFKIPEYKNLVVRVPFHNGIEFLITEKKKRNHEYENLSAQKFLLNLEKYLVKPLGKTAIIEGFLQMEESLLEDLEQKYSFKLTRETYSFPLLRNFYSKQLQSEMEEVIVVEIKPKIGVVEPLMSEAMQERAGSLYQAPYCVLKEKKQIKLGEKKVSTNYDPRMLYSGDEEAMLEALRRLSSAPN